MQTTEHQQQDFICTIARALEPGDEVILNDRTRPLEVLGFEEQHNPGLINSPDYPYHIQWLRGNGTDYRLRWSHQGSTAPLLDSESQLRTRETYSPKHGEVTTKSVAKGRGEQIRRISVVGVEDNELTAWALDRLVTVDKPK